MGIKKKVARNSRIEKDYESILIHVLGVSTDHGNGLEISWKEVGKITDSKSHYLAPFPGISLVKFWRFLFLKVQKCDSLKK